MLNVLAHPSQPRFHVPPVVWMVAISYAGCCHRIGREQKYPGFQCTRTSRFLLVHYRAVLQGTVGRRRRKNGACLERSKMDKRVRHFSREQDANLIADEHTSAVKSPSHFLTSELIESSMWPSCIIVRLQLSHWHTCIHWRRTYRVSEKGLRVVLWWGWHFLFLGRLSCRSTTIGGLLCSPKPLGTGLPSTWCLHAVAFP